MTCGITPCGSLLLALLLMGLTSGAVTGLNAVGFTLVYGTAPGVGPHPAPLTLECSPCTRGRGLESP